MATFEDGSYSCTPGIALLAKVMAGRCTMRYTRVAVGSGSIAPGQSPQEMTAPAGYVMDAEIASVSTPVGGECQVSIQIDSDNVETGFYCTGVMLYAEDPDEGEVPYTYLVLETGPEWIRPSGAAVGKIANFNLIAAVGEVDSVVAHINTDVFTTRGEAEAIMERTLRKALVKRDIVIPSTGWITGVPEAELTVSEVGTYYIDIPQNDVTEDFMPVVCIYPADAGTARDCGLSCTARTLEGTLRLYAEKQPTAEIRAHLYLQLSKAAYRVRFMSDEDTVYATQWIVGGDDAVLPFGTPTKPSTAQYDYSFDSWEGDYHNINAPTDITAAYTATLRKYTVTFWNGETLLQTVEDVPYGGSASYTGTTPLSPTGDPTHYPFEGWFPSPGNIQGDTACVAQFGEPAVVEEISDSWEQIIQACADGTAATRYKVGNYKPLDLGSEGVVNMQIAAKNKEDLADGSGKAPISWISKELLSTSHRMNPARSDGPPYTESTGSIGGWEKTEMRSYLNATIKPLIPAAVRAAIKAVTKTQPAYDINGSQFTQTTSDELWLPSYAEMYGDNSLYWGLFENTNTKRVKCKSGSTSAAWWWLRSARSSDSFTIVYSDGYYYGNGAHYTSGSVALGFCT